MVDPHDDSRELYAAYFKWAGVHVTAVPLSVDALRVMRGRAPDAVITCLRLPGMDGFELSDAIRAMPETSRTPVIAFSTCLPEHLLALRDRRFAAVLMKPCLPETVLKSLRRVLRRRSRTMELSGPAASVRPD